MLLDGFFMVKHGMKYGNDVTFSGSYITLNSLPEINFSTSYFIFYIKEMMSKKSSSTKYNLLDDR